MKKGIIVILLIFFIISIIVNLEIGFRVLKYGYLVIYSNDIPSIIPSFIKYLSTIFPLLVFISLSFLQEKKERKIVLLMYFIYLCSTLLTGVRGEFCIGIIIILICLYTQKFLVNKNVFNKKKILISVIISFILIPLFIVGLNIFNSIRNKESDYNHNAFIQFANFFVNQGSSVNLISLAIDNEDELNEYNHIYTVGPVIENVESKVKKLVDIDLIKDRHTSFARDISIIGLGREGYESGQGLGSQYLAELYLDYDIIGIIVYSFLLGIMIKMLSCFYKYNFLGYSLSLVLIQSILFLPRNQALQFVNAIFSFNYWILIFIIVILLFIKKKKENKNV